MTSLCDIQSPCFVAVTANQTVLVSTTANTLCKVTCEGTTHQIHSQHQNEEIYANDLNQDHKSTKWRWLQDPGETHGWMDDLVNAAFIVQEE